MSNIELSEQEIIRRNALTELRNKGIEPYPAAAYPVDTTSEDIRERFDPEKGNYQDVCLAGRIMSRRIMGKASFAELQDEKGRIQLYVNRDELCPGEDKTLYNDVFKRLLDIGDIIGVKGFAFVTQMGERSIHVKELTLLSKSLKVLPMLKKKMVWCMMPYRCRKRYRQRYVDWW
jgi:lysyl-tRNA synthetase class 2